MDKNGQLTFSDDPLLNAANEIYLLIEDGDFKIAISKLDELLNINPEYPGLIPAFRTAKFWDNRTDYLKKFKEGKETATFLMEEWAKFDEYSHEVDILKSNAYKSAMRFIFLKASHHYRIAFQKLEDQTGKFDLLLNLGDCLLRLEEYKNAIEILEYAKNSFTSNARLLVILAESHFHLDDIPKSLLYFREAFFINPTEIDLSLIKSKPILELIEIISKERPNTPNIKEWIPIYGFLSDIFYVRKNLHRHQIDLIEKEIVKLEVVYQRMNKEQIKESNALPRLINKYLWLLDYYEFQNYNFENLSEIKKRLISLDESIFLPYFKK